MNLQELLLSYFAELDQDVQIVVADVYKLERENSDYYVRPRNVLSRIKDIVDREADFNLMREN